jgi:hypothetical protein
LVEFLSAAGGAHGPRDFNGSLAPVNGWGGGEEAG